MDKFEILSDNQPTGSGKKPCQACKKGLNGTHWAMIVLSIYILISSVYGTFKLIGLISSLF